MTAQEMVKKFRIELVGENILIKMQEKRKAFANRHMWD